jgi:hypothetical protein
MPIVEVFYQGSVYDLYLNRIIEFTFQRVLEFGLTKYICVKKTRVPYTGYIEKLEIIQIC